MMYRLMKLWSLSVDFFSLPVSLELNEKPHRSSVFGRIHFDRFPHWNSIWLAADGVFYCNFFSDTWDASVSRRQNLTCTEVRGGWAEHIIFQLFGALFSFQFYVFFIIFVRIFCKYIFSTPICSNYTLVCIVCVCVRAFGWRCIFIYFLPLTSVSVVEKKNELWTPEAASELVYSFISKCDATTKIIIMAIMVGQKKSKLYFLFSSRSISIVCAFSIQCGMTRL